MSATLKELLQQTLDQKASDLHLGVGAAPKIRIDGHLRDLESHPTLTAEDTKRLCYEVLDETQRARLAKGEEIDLSFSLGEKCRVRGNVFLQQATIAGAFRQIPFRIPTFEELGLPEVLMRLTERSRGLVLVTGPTGSGKSTTLAAMLDRINEQRHDHIITIEDPIEYLYQQKNCVIAQREVNSDTQAFSAALKYALRQDPDVILVGEMRDLETIQNAITAAETGHLVFATLHTNNAVQTVDRIIDVFSPHQQPQVRTQLSFILEAVVSQTLIPRKGGGRVLAQEIMIPSLAIRNLIRENKTHQIYASMQVGQQNTGMVTMNQALLELVHKDIIDFEEAKRRATDLEDFLSLANKSRKTTAGAGITAGMAGSVGAVAPTGAASPAKPGMVAGSRLGPLTRKSVG